MARQRMIKPEVWSDEKLSKVTRDARLLFIGLWTASDDHGVCKANAVFLRNSIFPYDPVSIQEVANWLNSLLEISVIKPYKVNGESYLFIANFDKHQTMKHQSKPVHPSPPESFDCLRYHQSGCLVNKDDLKQEDTTLPQPYPNPTPTLPQNTPNTAPHIILNNSTPILNQNTINQTKYKEEEKDKEEAKETIVTGFHPEEPEQPETGIVNFKEPEHEKEFIALYKAVDELGINPDQGINFISEANEFEKKLESVKAISEQKPVESWDIFETGDQPTREELKAQALQERQKSDTSNDLTPEMLQAMTNAKKRVKVKSKGRVLQIGNEIRGGEVVKVAELLGVPIIKSVEPVKEVKTDKINTDLLSRNEKESYDLFRQTMKSKDEKEDIGYQARCFKTSRVAPVAKVVHFCEGIGSAKNPVLAMSAGMKRFETTGNFYNSS